MLIMFLSHVSLGVMEKVYFIILDLKVIGHVEVFVIMDGLHKTHQGNALITVL